MPFMWRHQLRLVGVPGGSGSFLGNDYVLRYRCSCGWESVASPPHDRKVRDRQRNAHAEANYTTMHIRFEIV